MNLSVRPIMELYLLYSHGKLDPLCVDELLMETFANMFASLGDMDLAIEFANRTTSVSLQERYKQMAADPRYSNSNFWNGMDRCCRGCFKITKNVLWCGCCRITYCGVECQQKDWKKHRGTCTYVKK